MRTLAVLSSKGGTGKTTLAVHLAMAGFRAARDTRLIDLDPQRSAMDWRRERSDPAPEFTAPRPGALFALHQGIAKSGTELLFIDTRPAAEADGVEAARLADLCLIVVRPSFLDLKAVTRTVQLIERLNRQAVFVINQAPPRRNGKEPPAVEQAIAALRSHPYPLAPVGLRTRSAYAVALGHGLTAPELNPDSSASAEIGMLWKFVAKTLWPTAKGRAAPAGVLATGPRNRPHAGN